MDFLFLTETWHKGHDGLLFNQITPPGFGTLNLPRSSGRGGGIIAVYNWQFNVSAVTIPQYSTFECLVLSVSGSTSTIIAIVYKPPKIKSHAAFMSDFADFLTMLTPKFHRILIVGDFNIHVDQSDSAMAKEFLSLLDCFNFSQLVTSPTHCKGHTLDLVLTNGSFASQLSSVDIGLSDHSSVFFDLELHRPSVRTPRTVTFRKWKSIDQTAFSNSVISILGDLHLKSLDEKVSQLNNTLIANLDTFAPLRTRKVTFAHSAPWYNDNLCTKKAACRKMEHKWRLTGLNVYYLDCCCNTCT